MTIFRSLADIALKNRKVQVLLLLLVAVMAMDGGFYMIRVRPANFRAIAAEDRLRNIKRSVSLAENEYGLYSSFESGRSDLEKFKGLLPRQSEYTAIIRRVYSLAKEDGMKATSFGTEKKEILKKGELVQISFSMPVTGTYQQVRKFIHDTETSTLFLNIEDLGLSSSGMTGEVSLTIGLSTYMRS